MILRKHKGPLLHDPEMEKTARSNRKKTKARMANNMVSREEMERAMAERLEAERARWLEEQAAETLRNEEREREKSCLDSITPQLEIGGEWCTGISELIRHSRLMLRSYQACEISNSMG